jgi:hypothetical protein
MSIYATLWSIQVQDPASPSFEPRWVEVTAQAVPAHIGSPTPGNGYEAGDPFASFLPPPMETDEHGEAPFHRAVVFVSNETEKGVPPAQGQQYVNPLLVLTGREYATITFSDLLDRLQEAVKTGPRVLQEGEHEITKR